jgi:DNA-binding transcriptional ArsR family regulator
MTASRSSKTAITGVRSIDDPETLRLIADPLRLRLIELVRQAPRTVTELAGLTGVGRTRLYYHVGLLESHGLFEVDATRVISGITEKRYRVTAQRFTVDKTLLGQDSSDRAPLDVFLSVVLEEVAGEIRRSVAAGIIDLDQTHQDAFEPNRLVLGRKWFALDDDDVRCFETRFKELEQEFADARANALSPAAATRIGKTLYELLIAFYPIAPGDGEA